MENKNKNEKATSMVDVYKSLTGEEISGFMKFANIMLEKMSEEDDEAKMLFLVNKIEDKIGDISLKIHKIKDDRIKENNIKRYNILLDDIEFMLDDFNNNFERGEYND